MLDIGSTEFMLAVPSLPEAELKKLSTSLFDSWDGFVDTALTLHDYSLFLQVEEGSVRGLAKIGALAGAFYLAIGNYGDFVSGVKTIGEQVGATNDFLSERAKEVFNCPDSKATYRKRGGAVTGLQRLFVRVQRGELSPEQAMAHAERLLGDEQHEAPGLMSDLAEALRDCPRYHEQQTFPFEQSPEDLVPTVFDRQPIPREPRPRPEIGPPLHLRVEVWRESKKKRRHTRVVKL